MVSIILSQLAFIASNLDERQIRTVRIHRKSYRGVSELTEDRYALSSGLLRRSQAVITGSWLGTDAALAAVEGMGPTEPDPPLTAGQR